MESTWLVKERRRVRQELDRLEALALAQEDMD